MISNWFKASVWKMGFRPFFLLGSLHAVMLVLYWVGGLQGYWTFPGTLNMVTVHMHEMVFGFAAAIIAGFLLTASSNWTRTRGLHGESLGVLVVFWILGRAGVLLALLGFHPMWLWLDILFLPGVIIAIAPSLWRARKWNNISVLFWLSSMLLGHILFLLETSWLYTGWGRRGLFLGLNSVVFFILLIGGRILPFFTKNYFKDPEIKKWPEVDLLALACTTAFVFSAFVLGELHTVTGIAASLAGLSNLLRMRHWHSWRTRKTPILWVLHLSYLWMVVAFFLHASATQGWVSWSAALHAYTVGGIGGFVLGMISRVSLGHSGRPLQVSKLMVVAYILMLSAGFLRVLARLLPPAWYHHAIALSGAGWALAFMIFLWIYTPILISPRADGKDG